MKEDSEIPAFDFAVIGTGIALGVVHVLTGPDHLSALATLSSEVSDGLVSFWLGVRWGFGHSFGLMLVGSILLIRDISTENTYIEVPDVVSNICESFVGLFMVFLGIRGFFQASQKRRTFREENLATNGSNKRDEEGQIVTQKLQQPQSLEDEAKYVSYQNDPMGHFHAFEQAVNKSDTLKASMGEESLGHKSCCAGFGCNRNLSIRSLAILSGTIHGFAGPGGVLGVIPAVEMHNLKLAAMYMGCFCLSSTLTMGCFALIYGTISSRLGKRMYIEFQIQIFSAFLSFLVGVTWLVLLYLGILDDIFP